MAINESELEEAKMEIGKIIKDLNSSTACFTGHRSQKLPWRFNEEDARCQAMKATLAVEIEKAIQRGYRTFLSGMALGFDMICTETVLAFKDKYPDIKIIGALPCKTQDIKCKRETGKGIEVCYAGSMVCDAFMMNILAQSVCLKGTATW